ncbi:MAG TPA: alpha/beta hydrolase [Gemmatimonadota bacterium]
MIPRPVRYPSVSFGPPGSPRDQTARVRRRAGGWIAALFALAGCAEDPAGPGPDAAGDQVRSGAPFLAALAVDPVSSCTVPPVLPTDQVNKRGRTYYSPGGDAQKLFVEWPKNAGPGLRPLVVLIHGGSWRSGNPRSLLDEGRLLVGAGYVVASVGYRFAPQHTFPAQIEDVRCAIRYLRENAATYGIDPSRVAAVGQSAGGHLASLLGTAAGASGLDGSCPFAGSPDVDGVVSFYGPQDLTDLDLFTTLQDEVVDFLGGTPDSDPDLAALASPIEHVDAGDPPFLLLHKTGDNTVPIVHSETMDDALQAAGVPSTFIEVNQTGHTWPMFSTRSKHVEATCTTLAFLEQTLNP